MNAEELKTDAEFFINYFQQAVGETLLYDADSLGKVDNYLSQHASAGFLELLIEPIGAYLGECIRLKYDGLWSQIDDEWVINIDGNKVYPFKKAYKRVHIGEEHSIQALFLYLPAVLKLNR